MSSVTSRRKKSSTVKSSAYFNNGSDIFRKSASLDKRGPLPPLPPVVR